MQAYTGILGSKKLSESRQIIIDNFDTIMSNNSGTAFPTTNLQIGMVCDRTDLQGLYKLKDLTPTWVLVFDYSKTATNKEYVDTQIATRVPTSDVVVAAQANKLLKLNANSKLPASITGDAATVNGGIRLTIGAVPANPVDGKELFIDTAGSISSTKAIYVRSAGAWVMVGGSVYMP